jgi:hypothetical protein
VDTLSLPTLYTLFFCFFIAGGAVGPIIATVSKESFPIAISGTSVSLVNLFPFAGATFFQILIGAVLTAQSHGQKLYEPLGFQYMFFICLGGATLSLVAAAAIKETLPAAVRM